MAQGENAGHRSKMNAEYWGPGPISGWCISHRAGVNKVNKRINSKWRRRVGKIDVAMREKGR